MDFRGDDEEEEGHSSFSSWCVEEPKERLLLCFFSFVGDLEEEDLNRFGRTMRKKRGKKGRGASVPKYKQGSRSVGNNKGLWVPHAKKKVSFRSVG